MGSLSNDSWTKLLKESEATQAAPASPTPTPTSAPARTSIFDRPQEGPSPFNLGSTPPPNIAPPPRLNEEQQTARYGGPVGSAEYYKGKSSTLKQLPRALGESFGIHLPPPEEFDTMSRVEQIGVVGGASAEALVNFVLAAPKEIAKAPFRYGYSVYRGWRSGFTGEKAAEEVSPTLPLLGSIPSYYKNYEDAKASGMGPLAAGLQTGSMALGDITIAASVAETLNTAFRPRAALKPGEMVQNTTPIQTVLEESEGILRTKRGTDSPAEYYSIPKTQAAKYGGNSGNTFVKLNPVSPDGSLVELSIVQTKRGPADRINTFFGLNKNVTAGKYGPEQKIFSQVVEMDAVPNALKSGVMPELNVVPEGAGNQIVIPSAPLKGSANKPITSRDISNLSTIGKVNGLERDLQVGIIKAITGKSTVTELTQAEYVNVAQTMAKLNGASKYAPEATGFGTKIQSYVSPTRYWTRNVQERTGIPVHDAHTRIETAARLSKISEQSQLGELFDNPVIKKFADPKFAEERRLVRAFREGDTAAITDNAALTPEVKAELISAAKIFDDYYAKVGPDVGVPVDIFIDNYSPHISDIGGKFQLYKDKGVIPTQSTFFAKQKRHGSLSTMIDDEWALAEIYTRGGYKAKYYDPIFKDINSWADNMPPEIKARFGSYVQEKLGYAGEFEKILDSVATTLNDKFGWNLPPDTARVMTNQAMNTMYSSAMSQPATWVRNSFQYPMMGYAYWGPKFMGRAMAKSLSREGQAEFMKSGFSVDLGIPFGEELAREATGAGRLSNAYRQTTQGILKPNSIVENRNRASMYFQTKFIFEDTLSRYNAGKLTWEQAEAELGLPKMNRIDANQIRQDLVNGEMDAAFQKLAQNAIDDTQFPYRRGESMKLSYGMSGHLGTAFMQWPVEYTHTLGKWVATGQFDKVVRLMGSTSLIVRTFRDQFGIDFGSSFGLSPLVNTGLSPVANVINEGTQAIYDWLGKNEEELQKHQDELMRQARLGVPGGLQGQNVINAWRAYKEGPIGPDGTYAIRNQNGTLNYYAPFRDVFWAAMGFPPVEKVANRDLQKQMANEKFDYSSAKRKVVELYQDGLSMIEAGDGSGQKYLDEANKIIEEYAAKGLNLAPDGRDFDKYYIPATERTYNALPDGLKANFAPRVFK